MGRHDSKQKQLASSAIDRVKEPRPKEQINSLACPVSPVCALSAPRYCKQARQLERDYGDSFCYGDDRYSYANRSKLMV